MKYLLYIKKLKEFKCRSQIETKHFKNVTHVLSGSFYVMCLYIVWISKRVQIFIWLHFSWYLLYLIIFSRRLLFIWIKSIIMLVNWKSIWKTRVVGLVIYVCNFLHWIFCLCSLNYDRECKDHIQIRWIRFTVVRKVQTKCVSQIGFH